MIVNDLKQSTVYDKLNRKRVVKVGEKWIDGHFGVVTIERIYRVNNKACTTTILFTIPNGALRAAKATQLLGVGVWGVRANLLFRVDK